MKLEVKAKIFYCFHITDYKFLCFSTKAVQLGNFYKVSSYHLFAKDYVTGFAKDYFNTFT